MITDVTDVTNKMFAAGKPKAPSIESRVEVMGGGSFRIGWRTDSYANIEQYRLLYRKKPVSIYYCSFKICFGYKYYWLFI